MHGAAAFRPWSPCGLSRRGGGVVVYGVAIAMLYLICGRPEGAERLLIDRFAPKLQAGLRMPR